MASLPPFRYPEHPMAPDGTAADGLELATLRERVDILGQRLEALGRHL